MVRGKASSLFKELTGSEMFEKFHYPEYLPSFLYFGPEECQNPGACDNVKRSNDEDCYEEVCGEFTGYLRESCCYDFAVTQNITLVKSIMIDAKKEDKIQIILNNTLPTIEGGPKQSVSVEVGEIADFVIRTFDEDGDNITAELGRSDRGLFNLSTVSPGLYYLSFAGAQLDGTWKAQVSISDGKSSLSDNSTEDAEDSILFTASVNVLPPPCLNDRSYRYNGIQNKSCVWVGENESRRQKLCSEKNKVRAACRMTCGFCCEDDQRYVYNIGEGVMRGCKWTAKRKSRSSKYCQTKEVSSNCPVTCAACQNKFTCTNDMNFRLDTENNKGSCAFIGRKEKRRLKWCNVPVVRRKCQTTCGLCCENNQDFVFITNDNKSKSCKWIAAKSKRINKYCVQPQILSNCPGKSTCNSCKEYVHRTG